MKFGEVVCLLVKDADDNDDGRFTQFLVKIVT